MKYSFTNGTGAGLVALLLTGCAPPAGVDRTGPAVVAQAPAPPSNLGDLKRRLVDYKESGAYDRDLADLIGQARAFVEERAAQVSRPAIVLDIDETTLSNWPEMVANDFGYIGPGGCTLPAGPCGMSAWMESGRAQAIGPMLALFNAAKAKEVTVFFLTGRSEALRAATESNLRAVGFEGWAGLVLRPTGSSTASAADYKAPERAKIAAQGYTIIANIGDQPSDLAGGYAERTFLVPNPFYRIQ